jgi:replicative DNA helicase
MGALVEAIVTASENGASPPQNLEAEDHVLGALLLAHANPDVIPDVLATGLSGADFYRDTNAKVFAATLALHEKGEPVEALTIVDELERRGDLDSVGGKVRIHELAAVVPASRNAPHYARLVLRQSRLRALVAAGAELQRLGAEAGDVAELTRRATEIIASLARPSTAVLEPLDLAEILTGPIPQTEWLWNGWIACGDLVIWAGDPGVGKSIVSLCLADATRRGATFLGEPCKRGRAAPDRRHGRGPRWARLLSRAGAQLVD